MYEILRFPVQNQFTAMDAKGAKEHQNLTDEAANGK
jgi:hypothetical protein